MSLANRLKGLVVAVCLGAAMAPASALATQDFALGNGVMARWVPTPYGVRLYIINTNNALMICEIVDLTGRWVRVPVGPLGNVYMDNPAQPLRSAGCVFG